MIEFKKGDKVLLKPESRWAYPDQDGTSTNPTGVVGVVQNVRGEGPLPFLVEWANGHTNSYETCDLEYAEPKKSKRRPPKLKQTKVYILYKDGTHHQTKRVSAVVLDPVAKEVHITAIRNEDGIVIRENTSIRFKDLEAMRVEQPDTQFIYFWKGDELEVKTQVFSKGNSPFTKIQH